MADTNFTDLGYVEETTFGTTPGSALQLLRRTGGNLTPRRNTTTSEEIRSDLRSGKPVRTAEWAEGDINIEWSYNTYRDILGGVLMENVASGVLVDGTTKRSFTFEDQITDPAISPSQYLIYKGCRIASVGMQISVDSIINGSFGIMGATPSNAQASSGTGAATAATTTGAWNSINMITALEEGDSGGTASSLPKVLGVDLSFDRALRQKREIGSINPFDLGVGRLMVTGTITQHFDDSRLADNWFAYTDHLLNIDITDDAGNLVEIEIPKMKYVDDFNYSIAGPDDDVTVEINFEAYADQGDPHVARFTFTDA